MPLVDWTLGNGQHHQRLPPVGLLGCLQRSTPPDMPCSQAAAAAMPCVARQAACQGPCRALLGACCRACCAKHPSLACRRTIACPMCPACWGPSQSLTKPQRSTRPIAQVKAFNATGKKHTACFAHMFREEAQPGKEVGHLCCACGGIAGRRNRRFSSPVRRVLTGAPSAESSEARSMTSSPAASMSFVRWPFAFAYDKCTR